MFRVIRFLFTIPRLIVRILLGVLWECVKTLLVLSVLGLGFLYMQSQSQEDFKQCLTYLAQEVKRWVNSSDEELLAPSPEQSHHLKIDDHVETGAHWPKPTARVYVATLEPTFVRAYEEAIDNWNQTEAFRFVRVSSEKDADIILTEYSDASTLAVGQAETEVNVLTKDLIKARVYLNAHYLLDDSYAYSYERILHTAEHELGHAIGLSHNDDEISLMQSSGSFHGIQAVDIKAVKDLYN